MVRTQSIAVSPPPSHHAFAFHADIWNVAVSPNPMICFVLAIRNGRRRKPRPHLHFPARRASTDRCRRQGIPHRNLSADLQAVHHDPLRYWILGHHAMPVKNLTAAGRDFFLQRAGIPKVSEPPISGWRSRPPAFTPLRVSASAHASPAGPAQTSSYPFVRLARRSHPGASPSPKRFMLIWLNIFRCGHCAELIVQRTGAFAQAGPAGERGHTLPAGCWSGAIAQPPQKYALR